MTKILNLSATDYGGAGKFSVDFNNLLHFSGQNSYLVVKESKNKNSNVIEYPNHKLENFFSKIQRKIAKIKWSNNQLNYDYYFYNLYERFSVVSAQKILKLIPYKPDVIFIHWVSDFLNAKIINELYQLTGAKIYWLMIDNAPITGGCHYPWTCIGYQTDCHACPAILPLRDKQLAQKNLAFKHQYLPPNIGLITFSQSDYERAIKSSLFKEKVIVELLGFVDENKFTSGNKISARTYFELPINKKVVFFGATSLKEKRKGMALILDFITHCPLDVIFLIAGQTSLTFPKKNVKMIGHLEERELIQAYQAADLFICPSLEDSGPIMINQSIMCGTPVVAFDTGVAKNLVITGKTGYRAALGNIEDFIEGINYILNLDVFNCNKMAKDCRELGINSFGTKKFKEKLNTILS